MAQKRLKILAIILAGLLLLVSCNAGSRSIISNHFWGGMDPLGRWYSFTNRSDIYVPNTTVMYSLESTFTRVSAPTSSMGYTIVSWGIENGYSSIETDMNYHTKLHDNGEVVVTFSVPTSVSEFSVSVQYSFADMFVSDVPLGWARTDLSDINSKITQSTELYEIAMSFSCLADVFEWFSKTLKYRTGTDSVRSDIETLHDGGGDCDELVYLFMSLLEKSTLSIDARAVGGILTRTWSATSDRALVKNYHVIAQIFLDEKWRLIDISDVVRSNGASVDFISLLRQVPVAREFVGKNYNYAGVETGTSKFTFDFDVRCYDPNL